MLRTSCCFRKGSKNELEIIEDLLNNSYNDVSLLFEENRSLGRDNDGFPSSSLKYILIRN